MNRNVTMIGVPMDLGQNRRGVDMGPSAIRYAGVLERIRTLGYNIEDKGDIQVKKETLGNENIHNLSNLEPVTETNKSLASTVSSINKEGRFPLILGGDHSIAIGTIAGMSGYFDNLGAIWYDAHGDLNTADTSPSGNIHGMPLAVSLGLGHPTLTKINGDFPKIKPENVIIIGARELDKGEKDYIRQSGLNVYTMHEIDRLGMSEVMHQSINYLKHRCDGVHLSLDLDSLDPHDAPGVGTPVLGGLTYRESHLAMEMLAEAKMITSAEFVEVNPILDEKNKTAEAAVALMGSLFGEKLK
ncbi:arginase [Alteribacillus sp. YIM 98480]|uniref:arginase n=1 Tax=Alteribacillus sp. YIM 98480 TaxID=2606599 RepID=UPI00131B898B|nr:arginase [Alteribacillus sp. YIM 98480]